MKQTWVIGSTVVDVLLSLPSLPLRGSDINISASEYRIGGCAYNVFSTLRLFKSPALLCSPVGSGVYGRMVRESLEKEGLLPFVSLDEENGCCYCLIEPDGERTFLSHHGAEYLFSRSWMDNIDYSRTDGVYVSGIEVEDPTGPQIIDFVCEHPELELYFAPGPRIMHINSERMDRLLVRRDRGGQGPLLHLNKQEALQFTAKATVEEGVDYLAEKTGNSVIITLGEDGCYCLKAPGTKGKLISGFPARVIDTVGAGDAHCGAIIACLKMGMNLEEACVRANRIGAAVAGIKGAVLDTLPDS